MYSLLLVLSVVSVFINSLLSVTIFYTTANHLELVTHFREARLNKNGITKCLNFLSIHIIINQFKTAIIGQDRTQMLVTGQQMYTMPQICVFAQR